MKLLSLYQKYNILILIYFNDYVKCKKARASAASVETDSQMAAARPAGHQFTRIPILLLEYPGSIPGHILSS